MARIVPKQHGSAHFPGMEGSSREGEYWTGLLSVGYSVVDATIGVSTNPSLAQMQASPNTRATTHMCAGAVVHSLGQEPALVVITPIVSSGAGGVSIVQITADNSAVYALGYKAGATNETGLGVRVVAIAP